MHANPIAYEPRTHTARCVNCEAEINWQPIRRFDQAYCCLGCASGGPCICTYDLADQGGDDAVDHLGLPFGTGPDRHDDDGEPGGDDWGRHADPARVGSDDVFAPVRGRALERVR
ncbi:MAG: hypothetical protein ACRDGQ_14925 [Candidatus Limnocylindrales bacterium]